MTQHLTQKDTKVVIADHKWNVTVLFL